MLFFTTSERPADAGRFARDFLVGLALLAFCAVAYWVTLDFKEAPAALAQNVQPATFPRMVIGVISALAVLMITLGASRYEPRRRAPRPIMLITAALMVGFVIAFDTLGLTFAIGLFCLVMPRLWGARWSVKLVVFAIAFPTAVYLVFAVGLGVYFPPGVIEQLLGQLS